MANKSNIAKTTKKAISQIDAKMSRGIDRI
jgi:hypothetical protein